MSKYVLVNNRPNQIATVHLSNCAHLGPDPLVQTVSAERAAFDDGLEAIKAASGAKSFGVCGHCLAEYRQFVAR